MIRILLIAPFQEFLDAFTPLFEKHNATIARAEYENENYELSSVLATGTHELGSLDFDAEVVVSRGFVSSELRRQKFFVPVIEVPVAAVDLVHSLHRVRTEYLCDRVAVIGSENMVMGVDRLSQMFSMEIRRYALNAREEIRGAVDAAAADGIPVVIGGVTTCSYARQKGLHAVLVESGPESIWHSITEAKRLAYLVKKEREHNEHLVSLVNQAKEGIVTLDGDGSIRLFNKAAADIFDMYPSNAVGKDFRKVLPAFSSVFSPGGPVPVKDEIVKCGEKLVSASFSGLGSRGERNSTLVMVQDVTRVQELETRIRERVYSRGHVARHRFSDIIGSSPSIVETIERAKKFSRVDSNILMFGKTGTGKELFAQSIHNHSPRGSGPFVAVNCAALSESLLESELFGYVEGAFTGASKGGKPGLFELAHRGSLFLDEISEIPMRLQGRLLRAIQEKEIMRLGHDRVIPVDVRIIAAANCSLADSVAAGSFREDLYYRLNILKIDLPSLVERSEDIPSLADYWVGLYCAQFSYPAMALSEAAKRLLGSLSWPGNIRQLRNVCERLVVLSQGSVIDERDVAQVLETEPVGPAAAAGGDEADPERELIAEALRRTGNNKHEAARVLGISRTTLWRRLKQMKLS